MTGGGSNVYAPPTGNLQAQNAQLNTTLGQNATALNNYAPAISSQAQGFGSQIQNNPYQAAAQTGAGVAGAYGTGTVAPQEATAGLNLQGLGTQNASYAPQALQTGFDPQNALYNRNYQQTMDQTNALNAMSGVSNSPYAASVAGNVGNNFNLDWLNQALGRQSTAAGTASTLTGAADSAYSGAGADATNALNTYATASALPSQTYENYLTQQLASLSGENTAVQGATSQNDAFATAIQNYLQYGTNAQQTNYQDSASALGGLGSLFGSLLGAGGGKGAGSSIFSDLLF
jgi:hypothetical protein